METTTLTKTDEEVKEVTTEQLRNFLFTLKRGSFSNIVFDTDPGMNKGRGESANKFYGLIKKHTDGNILVGFNYETRVQNNTGNTEFVAQPSKVGEHLTKCVLYNENTCKYYLQYEWFKEKQTKRTFKFIGEKPLEVPNLNFNVNKPIDEESNPVFKTFKKGDDVEKKYFEEHLKKYKPNIYGVNCQSITIDNIVSFKIDKIRYVVKND